MFEDKVCTLSGFESVGPNEIFEILGQMADSKANISPCLYEVSEHV